MKRLIPMICALCLILTGCGTGDTQTEAPTPTISPEATVTADPDNPNGYTGINPLTGALIDETKVADRPIAVMMNNLKVALPQYGVSRADIIYEVLAEGGITRMVAVFQDTDDVARIGSVRSTRPYYLDIAQGLDAILIHAGGSEQAYSDIKNEGITALDGVRGNKESELFWRDADRIKNAGYEHSVFTSGERIEELLPTYSIRLRHEDDYEYRMKFAEEGTPEKGDAAAKISVYFSDYKTGVFEYDTKTKLYMVSEYGKEYVDGETEAQVSVTNVLILRTKISQIPGDTAGRLDVRMTGRGEGSFACGGKSIDIKWSKASDTEPFRYTTDDGTELVMGKGVSYVNIIPAGNHVSME